MEVSVELVRAESIEQLISSVAESRYKHVHVSTHGVVRKSDSFSGWWSANGIGRREAFSDHENAFVGKSLVSTACNSGAKAFGEHVVGFLGAKHYIGPEKSPYWHNAALFSHIYYYKLFGAKRTVARAFESYAESYKNPHKFRLFTKA
jgi:hypothetical protein